MHRGEGDEANTMTQLQQLESTMMTGNEKESGGSNDGLQGGDNMEGCTGDGRVSTGQNIKR